MVNKQRQNSLTRIFLIFDNWCHRFWSFHHSIVGNIEVFGAHKHNYNFRPSVSVFSHSGNAIGGRSSGTFQV
jgi:hypothetical protein